MPRIIIPLCEKPFSWAFHLFFLFFKGQMESRMADNHPSV